MKLTWNMFQSCICVVSNIEESLVAHLIEVSINSDNIFVSKMWISPYFSFYAPFPFKNFVFIIKSLSCY